MITVDSIISDNHFILCNLITSYLIIEISDNANHDNRDVILLEWSFSSFSGLGEIAFLRSARAFLPRHRNDNTICHLSEPDSFVLLLDSDGSSETR